MQDRTFRPQLNLLNYWRIILRFKWMITGLVVASVLVTGVVSRFSPKLYEAKATLMPAREESPTTGGFSFGGGGGLGNQGGGGGSITLGRMLGVRSGPSLMDTLNVFLHSRVMAETVIDQLDLMSYYGTKSRPAAVRALRGELKANATKWKSLELLVRSKDPKMAADIANAHFSHLARLYKEHTVTAEKRNRLFIEARLQEKSENLEQAENDLAAFQSELRAMSI